MRVRRLRSGSFSSSSTRTIVWDNGEPRLKGFWNVNAGFRPVKRR